MHAAAKYTRDNPDNYYLVKLIMGQSDFAGNTATQYGKNHEALARKLYSKAMKTHKSFKVKPAGLFINRNMPIIRASPDGIVTCKCCGKGLLEIKCPFKATVRLQTTEEVALTGKYHIYMRYF